jgi:type IV pilus assembly protein PilC
MPVFKYEATKRSGEKITGSFNAPNENEVRIFLRQQGARPTKIEGESIFNSELKIPFFSGKGVKDEEVSIFTRQLAVMVGSGVPLLQALDILASGERRPALKKALNLISEGINSGSPLWESMAKTKIFDNLFIYLVRAGEMAGALDSVLTRLAKYLDDHVRLMRMVRGAMVYPAVVSLVGIGVTVGLLTFVVPKFESMITASGGELPELTKMVISLSHFFGDYFLVLVGGAFVGAWLFKSWISTAAGLRRWHGFMLHAPLLGDLVVKSSTARFARTLGTMLVSGVNLIDAIEICKNTMGNVVIEDALAKVKEEISSGKSIALPLAQARIFPPMVIQMINVGENTGTLDQMLMRIADFYEAEVEALVANLSKIIEPVVLVVLGGVVAFILIAMYLPVFNIANVSQGQGGP